MEEVEKKRGRNGEGRGKEDRENVGGKGRTGWIEVEGNRGRDSCAIPVTVKWLSHIYLLAYCVSHVHTHECDYECNLFPPTVWVPENSLTSPLLAETSCLPTFHYQF